MRQYKKHRVLSHTLPSIEQRIAQLQEDLAEIDILKAGKHWREHGERSPGFLKSLTRAREGKRQISQLIDPVSSQRFSDNQNKQRIAHQFYSTLYSLTVPDTIAVDSLLRSIPSTNKLTIAQANSLLQAIEFDNILQESRRSPRKSSPGLDGLPYEILRLIFQFPPLQPLIVDIYNTALQQGVFPPSWNQSVMSLLPKKGDLTDLRNHRPISLANTDYKIFTRIINARMMSVSSPLINAFQLGFLPDRYIADNGMTLQLVMEDAKLRRSQPTSALEPVRDIALMLDQEKAYDRVNLCDRLR